MLSVDARLSLATLPHVALMIYGIRCWLIERWPLNGRATRWGLSGVDGGPICHPSDTGIYLRSLAVDYYWLGPVNISPNGVNDDKKGFWSIKSLETGWLVGRNWNMDACGVIEHTGEVVEYERGHRSTVATVRQLLVRHRMTSDEEIVELGNRYQCDVSCRPMLDADTIRSLAMTVVT